MYSCRNLCRYGIAVSLIILVNVGTYMLYWYTTLTPEGYKLLLSVYQIIFNILVISQIMTSHLHQKAIDMIDKHIAIDEHPQLIINY